MQSTVSHCAQSQTKGLTYRSNRQTPSGAGNPVDITTGSWSIQRSKIMFGNHFRNDFIIYNFKTLIRLKDFLQIQAGWPYRPCPLDRVPVLLTPSLPASVRQVLTQSATATSRGNGLSPPDGRVGDRCSLVAAAAALRLHALQTWGKSQMSWGATKVLRRWQCLASCDPPLWASLA